MTTCNYFQIKTLKAHYDKMVSQDWQTGNQPYFEPLQRELTVSLPSQMFLAALLMGLESALMPLPSP